MTADLRNSDLKRLAEFLDGFPRSDPDSAADGVARAVSMFFAGSPAALKIYNAIVEAAKPIGAWERRVSKSQVGFYRKRPFAAVWIPGRVLKGDVAPLVLSVFLKHRDASSRWKEIVEPAPGRFTHHLELRHEADVNDMVRNALAMAWLEAG